MVARQHDVRALDSIKLDCFICTPKPVTKITDRIQLAIPSINIHCTVEIRSCSEMQWGDVSGIQGRCYTSNLPLYRTFILWNICAATTFLFLLDYLRKDNKPSIILLVVCTIQRLLQWDLIEPRYFSGST